MRPKPIGIVGGAGPLAGASLLERILRLASSGYGCTKDADFPQAFLISYPFSEMLSPALDEAQLRKELRSCLALLRQNGSAVLAIACNTLHAFLDACEEESDLIHLPRAIAAAIPRNETPLVLCTSTSARFALHKRFFSCTYPDAQTQNQIDRIIDQILEGNEQGAIVEDLQRLIEDQTASTVILGCTELSLLTGHLKSCPQRIMDPLEILARKIVEESFNNTRGRI